MRQELITRIAVWLILLATMAVHGRPVLAANEVDALNDQVEQLYGDGKYKEATTVAEQAMALAVGTLGAEHPDTLRSINNLAALYEAQGRHAEAEAMHKRALAGREKVFGTSHSATLQSLNNLAAIYDAQGRYSEAEPLYRRALAGYEQSYGPDHEGTLSSGNNLANLYREMGRYAEAGALFKQALASIERLFGPEDQRTLILVTNLAGLYQQQGRYSDAEPLFKRVLEGFERQLGAEHPNTLLSVNNLASLYDDQGRDGDAERLYKRALIGFERVIGPDHPNTLLTVSNLGSLYWAQERYAEAEVFFQRALAGRERVLGAEHPESLSGTNNLAALYVARQRYAEAEPLFKRALAGRERVLGTEHLDTLTSVNNLAELYRAQDRFREAEPLYRRVLAASERTLGADHPNTLKTVNNLGLLYKMEERYAEAEPLYRRALAGFERVLGTEHLETIHAASNLAGLLFARSDWPGAAELWQRSTKTIASRILHGALVGDQQTRNNKSDAERLSSQFRNLIKSVFRLQAEGRAPSSAPREMFETAQWALGSEAARSLTQMAVRSAKSDAALATLVRERQDLAAEWQKREMLQTAMLGQEVGKRNSEAESENNARMAVIAKRIAEIDAELTVRFPDYTELASPAPLSLEGVQAQLDPDEALMLFVDTQDLPPVPQETFIWVITKTDLRWVRTELGTASLMREVATLRCGLDRAQWAVPNTAAQCGRLLGGKGLRMATAPLPFDLGRAHMLYKTLFGAVEDMIKDKHLLIVPSGALTQLPFQVLITATPEGADFRTARWLARDHALTVLPAVSSLKALRATGRPSAAARPLIGFGNPLLDGPDARDLPQAKEARNKQDCPRTAPERSAALSGRRGAVVPIVTRGDLVDPSLIRLQSPLPETADELCAVARDIGADAGEIHLGARATEAEVKRLSETGALTQYRVVHFSTHATMAGQLSDEAEPGLLLTPPETATETDDGYLTSSEIAGLKLDADWVILSACNTAAGDASSAEALSGLARAFFYAQARALLVSHWAVETNAAVALITGTMGEITRGKGVGRAEALRRAMRAMIDKGEPYQAHPEFWAPFVVVGEGAR